MEFSPLIKGKIWKLGDNIDTDIIVPSRVLTEQDKAKLLGATLELVYPNFAKNVQIGDIIVGGHNFGCGSSREEAVYVLKELGIRSIVARSFARIFYRNCINLGLPPIICDVKHDIGTNEEHLEINLEKGMITNLEQNKNFSFRAFPPLLFRYLKAGGAFGTLKDQS